MTEQAPFTKEEWSTLPIELRRRWWVETNYGQDRPSEDLRKAIDEALRARAALNCQGRA